MWRISHQRCSIKKAVFRIFAIFTEKQLCLRLRNRCFPVDVFKDTYFEEHLRTAAFAGVGILQRRKHLWIKITVYSWIKRSSSFVTLEIQVFYWVSICKLLKYCCPPFSCEVNFCRLLHIRPFFKTLVLRAMSPFCSICQLFCHMFFYIFFMWVFFHEHSRITGLQGKGEGISLTPHYHFHTLHRQTLRH